MEEDEIEKNANKIFKALKGEIIQEFSGEIKKNSPDRSFHLITNKTDLKFGANDLGFWIEECKKIEKD